MTRKKIVVILFSLIVLFAVWFIRYAGNSNPNSSSATVISGKVRPNEPNDPLHNMDAEKEIRVAVAMDAAEFAELERLNKQFMLESRNIIVHLDNIPLEKAYELLNKAAQLGVAPDVMLLDNVWVNEFAALGYLSHRADEFFAGDTQSQLIESMFSQVKWNGYIWGVPKDVDPYILAWNEAKLEQLNMKLPPNTAEDLIAFNQLWRHPERVEQPELLEQLAEPSESPGQRETRPEPEPEPGLLEGQSPYGIYIDPTDPFALISLVWSLGGTWMGAKDGHVTVSDPNTIAALESFFTAKEDGVEEHETFTYIESYPFVTDLWNPWDALVRGELAMMVTTVTLFKEHAEEGIEMALLPMSITDEQTIGSWLKGRSYSVSSQSANVEEAFAWVRAMTSTSHQLSLMAAGGGLPASAAIYDSYPMKGNKDAAKIALSVERGKVFAIDPFLPRKLNSLQTLMSQLFNGLLGIKQFTDQIESEWTEIIDK